MMNFKRIIALFVAIMSLVLVFALTSCDFIISVDSFSRSNIEEIIDDALTKNNYTMSYEVNETEKVTLKIDSGRMHITIKSEAGSEDVYMYCDDEKGIYYYARDWKYGKDDKGFERTKLTKEQYIVKYMETYSQHSQNQKLFNYRHVLEMANKISDDHYEYFNEIYTSDDYLRKEYVIEYKDDALEIVEKHTEAVPNPDATNETDQFILVEKNIKTVYSRVDSMEITFPAKVTQ